MARRIEHDAYHSRTVLFFIANELCVYIYSASDRERSIVISVSVCLCVLSVRDHIVETTRPIFTNFWRLCSVLLWRRCDMLCTSGFMDDVIFAHKPRLLDVAAQLKRSAHAALGMAINCEQ